MLRLLLRHLRPRVFRVDCVCFQCEPCIGGRNRGKGKYRSLRCAIGVRPYRTLFDSLQGLSNRELWANFPPLALASRSVIDGLVIHLSCDVVCKILIILIKVILF
jgi:phosphoribosyl 1,2-cyclic phosphodiesterase